MTSIRIPLLIAAILFAATSCGAQSVAKLANSNRQEAAKGNPARVYTNQDLKNAKGNVSQSVLPQPISPTAATRSADSEGIAQSVVNSEEDFLQRFMDQFQAIEDAQAACEQAETDCIRAQSAYQSALPFDVYLPGAPDNVWRVERERPETIAVRRERLEAARQVRDAARRELEDAKQELALLRREARLKGIPAGVARRAEQDWAQRANTGP